MISQKLFTFLLYVALGINALYLLITGVILPPQAFKAFAAFGFVIGAVLLIFGSLDRHIWRWRFVHGWLHAAPDTQGTWKGELQSHWVDRGTGARPAPIEVYAVVRQTFSTVSIRMFTVQSSSESLVATLQGEKGSRQILATYRSTPDLAYRDKSPIHFGGFLLGVVGTPPQTLKGHYWTDRNTQGEFTFSQRKYALAESFETAKALFVATTSPVP